MCIFAEKTKLFISVIGSIVILFQDKMFKNRIKIIAYTLSITFIIGLYFFAKNESFWINIIPQNIESIVNAIILRKVNALSILFAVFASVLTRIFGLYICKPKLIPFDSRYGKY